MVKDIQLNKPVTRVNELGSRCSPLNACYVSNPKTEFQHRELDLVFNHILTCPKLDYGRPMVRVLAEISRPYFDEDEGCEMHETQLCDVILNSDSPIRHRLELLCFFLVSPEFTVDAWWLPAEGEEPF